MSEAEWLVCGSPWPMLKQLRSCSLPRKLRLLLCAFCRQSWTLFEADPGAQAVELAESLADGIVAKKELREVRRSALLRLVDAMGWREEDADFMLNRFSGFHFEDEPDWIRRTAAQLIAVRAVAEVISALHIEQVLRAIGDTHTGASDAEDCRLIRDIFGNPFRPFTFSQSWRTDTALSLARQIYESRDFGAMPILADALQDAGCDNGDILNHCRDANATHVRGCWVVDLVLDKK
jgi:hypothetical protein